METYIVKDTDGKHYEVKADSVGFGPENELMFYVNDKTLVSCFSRWANIRKIEELENKIELIEKDILALFNKATHRDTHWLKRQFLRKEIMKLLKNYRHGNP